MTFHSSLLACRCLRKTLFFFLAPQLANERWGGGVIRGVSLTKSFGEIFSRVAEGVEAVFFFLSGRVKLIGKRCSTVCTSERANARRASTRRVSKMCVLIALGFFAAKHTHRKRKGDAARVVCSLLGSADNPRPNLPAVFGHGLLLCAQSLMSSTQSKIHKLDFNLFKDCCMQSDSSVSFNSCTLFSTLAQCECVYMIQMKDHFQHVWRLAV